MKNFHFMAMTIAMVMLASCAKEKPILKNDLNGMHLKMTTVPVVFGTNGTVQLTRFEPTKNQTVFAYTITAGDVAVDKLDIGIQICGTIPEVISVIGGSANYASESALTTSPEYKNSKWLKLAVKVPPKTKATVTVTLKGYWDAKPRNSFLFGAKTYAMASLEVPVCEASGTLATVQTNSVEPGTSGLDVTCEVLTTGGSEVYERGILYSYDSIPDPRFHNGLITRAPFESAVTGVGTYIVNIPYVSTSQTLYVIAYAINRCAICGGEGNEKVAYGSVLAYPYTAITYGTLEDTRIPGEPHTYRTLEIGNNIWMVDNLAYMPNDNFFFRQVSRKVKEFSGIYVYGYMGVDAAKAKLTEEFKKYGCLYDWKGAQTAICPTGWKLPSDDDWKDLEYALGMPNEALDVFGVNGRSNGDVGNKLKSNSTDDWFWDTQSCVKVGDNRSGFNAIGSGHMPVYNSNPAFLFEGQDAFYWTSSITSDGLPIWRDLKYFNIGVIRSKGRPEVGMSVRCVKEKTS